MERLTIEVAVVEPPILSAKSKNTSDATATESASAPKSASAATVTDTASSLKSQEAGSDAMVADNVSPRPNEAGVVPVTESDPKPSDGVTPRSSGLNDTEQDSKKTRINRWDKVRNSILMLSPRSREKVRDPC